MGKIKYRTCTYEGCGRKHYGRGYCAGHYRQLERGYELKPLIEPYGKEDAERCTHEWCDRLRYGTTLYCKEHSLLNRNNPRTCVITGCEGTYESSGMCAKHSATARKFGLSALQLNDMLMAGCTVCGSVVGLVIDHDHKCCDAPLRRFCGECNRGVLCAGCNLAIGHAYDSPDTLRRMAEYLEAYTA